MTSIVDALYQVKYNPFKCGQYLASFYSKLHKVDDNLLLAQLVIPLCSHHIFQNKLSNAVFGEKKQSSIWTIFSDRTNLYDLQERVDEFGFLTEQSLQYCLVNDWLIINTDKLSVEYSMSEPNNTLIYKSAANLGKLLSGFTTIDVYAFLGVKPL